MIAEAAYHSQEAFEARLADRRANPVLPLPHRAYWHVALMPGWEPIVAEQLALLKHVGLSPLAFVLAQQKADYDRFRAAALTMSVNVEVVGFADDFLLGEGPTINALWESARAEPDGSTLYFHTKGMSNPSCPHKRHWRRAMMRHVVAEWEHNLGKLAVDDLVGCAWQTDPNYPHFCGNFWAARNDWLANLPHPDEYRYGRRDFQWAGTHHSWQKRIYVETWVGSRPFHSVHDRVAIGYPLWSEAVYEVNYDMVPGFDWTRDFAKEAGL